MKSILLDTNNKTDITVNCCDETQYVFVIDKNGDYLFNFNLDRPNIKTEIIGIIIDKGNNINIKTCQNHLAPATASKLYIRSLLLKNSSFSFNGTIRIEKKAQLSNAYQRNDNLLLSPDAFCTSKPNLEILANNITCTHGSATGPLNPDQLFYLRTRGLPEFTAKRVLVDAYISELANKIADRKIIEKIFEKVKSNYG